MGGGAVVRAAEGGEEERGEPWCLAAAQGSRSECGLLWPGAGRSGGQCRRRACSREPRGCPAAASRLCLGLEWRRSRAGCGAGGEGGGGEGGGGPGRWGKMPLAQLADPWQKMAVESPSDSAEVSAAVRQGRRTPSPRPRRCSLSSPELPLRPPSPACILFPVRDSALGRWALPISSIPPFPHPHLSLLWGRGVGGGCRCGGAWKVWSGRWEALQRACFNQLCVGESRRRSRSRRWRGVGKFGPAGSRGLLWNLSDFGFGSPGAKDLSLATGRGCCRDMGAHRAGWRAVRVLSKGYRTEGPPPPQVSLPQRSLLLLLQKKNGLPWVPYSQVLRSPSWKTPV